MRILRIRKERICEQGPTYSKPLALSLGVFAGLLLCIMFGPSRASASGFAVYTHGAKEWGMQNNVIAHSEGPASNYHNPALITTLRGTQIEVGTTVIFPSREFKSAQTGKTEKTESQVFYPSTLFATRQLDERFTAGLCVVSPFGLGTDWGKEWEGRYLATNSEMRTFNINLNIAWKLSDKLAVAGGLDLMLLDAMLEKNINSQISVAADLAAKGAPANLAAGLADVQQKFEGDGEGLGYNLGLVYRPVEDWSFGASYRSGIDVDVDGKAEFERAKSQNVYINRTLRTLFPETDVSTRINLPPQLFVGSCYKGVDRLTVELGARWEGWSCYEELSFKFDQPVGGTRTPPPDKKNWEDVISYSIGAKYDLYDTFAILGGYRFDNSPVPDDTFEPAIPSSDKHCVSFGVKKRLGNFIAGVSYYYERYESRKKNNKLGAKWGETANGEYNTDAHIAAVSVSYGF